MAKSVFADGMPRRPKKHELRPVDDTSQSDQAEGYVRLEPGMDTDAGQEVKNTTVEPDESAEKLVVPEREEVGIRSNEPDIDTLIDAERATLLGPEATWGQAAVEKRPLPWGWFALIGIAIFAVSAWAIKHIIFSQQQIDVIRVETEEILETEQSSLEYAMTQIDSLERAAFAFCEAESVDEMAKVVRHESRVRPLMEDHYSRYPFTPLGEPTIETLRPLTLGTHGDFWMASLRFAGGERISLILEARPDEPVRVDWETAVNYQPMNWDEYARTRPHGTSMDFRVYMTPDNHFSHEFRDPNVWDCYLLTARDSEEILFGYVKADNPSATLFRKWFERYPSQRASMIVRLSLPEDLASPRGVIIEHALSARWIYIVPPLPES